MTKSPDSPERSRQETNVVVRGGKVSFRPKKGGLIHRVADLSEEDWKRVLAIVPLSEKNRVALLAAISSYRIGIAADTRSLAAKRRVQRMRNLIRKLQREAEGLKTDPVFLNAQITDWGTRSGPSPEDVESRLGAIDELDQILIDAQDRMSGKAGRKSHRHLEFLIKKLVWIYADEKNGAHLARTTKAGFSRPTNRFVYFSVKAADPALSEASIANVLTRVIAEHYDILEKEGFNTATGEYV